MQYLVLYPCCFLRTKTLNILQNLVNQIILKVLNDKLQQSSEIDFRNLCRTYAEKSSIFDNRDVQYKFIMLLNISKITRKKNIFL